MCKQTEDLRTPVEENLPQQEMSGKVLASADAQDSLHNADKAKAELEKLKAELQSAKVFTPDYVVDQF